MEASVESYEARMHLKKVKTDWRDSSVGKRCLLPSDLDSLPRHSGRALTLESCSLTSHMCRDIHIPPENVLEKKIKSKDVAHLIQCVPCIHRVLHWTLALHACNLLAGEGDAGGSKGQDHHQLHELEISVGYRKPCLKTIKTEQNKNTRDLQTALSAP